MVHHFTWIMVVIVVMAIMEAAGHPIANNMSGIMSSEALFITFLRLRADLNPLKPSNSMPNYSEAVINDEQAQDLYAYINTLTDNPPQIDDIPALKNILDNAIRKNVNE